MSYAAQASEKRGLFTFIYEGTRHHPQFPDRPLVDNSVCKRLHELECHMYPANMKIASPSPNWGTRGAS